MCLILRGPYQKNKGLLPKKSRRVLLKCIVEIVPVRGQKTADDRHAASAVANANDQPLFWRIVGAPHRLHGARPAQQVRQIVTRSGRPKFDGAIARYRNQELALWVEAHCLQTVQVVALPQQELI